MAYTQADLDAIDDAIKQNVRSVTFSDGRQVVFSTWEELIQRRNFVATQLGMTAGRQAIVSRYKKGLAT